MAGVNKAIIVGHLGQDPELKHTSGGQPVCRLSVATTRTWNNKQTNEKQQETEWHRVQVWGKSAEHCAEYLAKGRMVYVEGRLKTSSYDDKDGVKRYTTEIVADTVQFLGGKNEGERHGDGDEDRESQGGNRSNPSRPAGGGYAPSGYAPPASRGPSVPDDDDIPF
jgi:single-strand DNA-binding protein